MQSGGAKNILDVRKPTEFVSHHVAGAQNFPLDYINRNMNRLDANETYYVHCLSGYRSVITASILKSRGFHHIIDIEQGWKGIEETDIPLSNYACPTELPQEKIDEAISAVI